MFHDIFVSLSSNNSFGSMSNSLATQLTYRIMAVVLVMIAIITGVVYFTVRKYMVNEANERYRALLQENQQELRRRLSDVYVATRNNVHDIERDIDDPDKMFDHMERLVNMNPYIVCSYVLFEPNYYPNKGRVFVPCAREDSEGKVRASRIDSTYHSYFYDVWFENQVKKEEANWTTAYYESQMFADGQDPRLLTTFTLPIHNREGRPVALLGSDMSLEDLRSRMLEDINEIHDDYEEGQKHQSYFFIIDQDGTFIIHPDKERMMKTMDEEVGRMMRTHRGTCVTEVDGVKSRMYYRSIKHVGWVMAIVVPENVITSKAKGLNLIILLTMFLGLGAIYLLCRQQIKEITNPFTAQQAALERELRIAHDIQLAMVPKSLDAQPLTSHLLPLTSQIDLYASLTPARDVGGDLYDFFLRDNLLFFCIGDVSGKGMPAALMMAVMRAMFRSETRRTNSAVAIVENMNHNLSEEYIGGYFVTMFVGILNLTTGHLDYCNAGHEAPLVIKKEDEKLKSTCLPVKPNLPVGALPEWDYEGQEAQLQPGNMLFLYTDGLSEAKNTAGEQLGRYRVMELASEHSHETTRKLVESMDEAVKLHAGDADQSDDITLLAIKCPQLAMAHCQLSMRSSMEDIASLTPFISEATEQAGMEEKEAKRIRLAVEEAVANVINHGEATTIHLQTSVEDDMLVFTINDDGLPFDPTQASATDLSVPPDQRPPGGMGIILLHQMTDGLAYQRIDGHNILTMKKKIYS